MPAAMQIRRDHPLHHLFAGLVERHLVTGAGIRDIEMARYVAGLLVQFTHVDNLYRIRNAKGRRLEEVGEMLIESNPLLEGRSFVYEREVRKHIGDYTMFMAGVFPEYVSRLPSRGVRIDSFVDYLKAGKESYRIVARFNQFEFESAAPLYRRLAERFELCVFGLNLVKAELQQNQQAWYGGVRQALES